MGAVLLLRVLQTVGEASARQSYLGSMMASASREHRRRPHTLTHYPHCTAEVRTHSGRAPHLHRPLCGSRKR